MNIFFRNHRIVGWCAFFVTDICYIAHKSNFFRDVSKISDRIFADI